MTTQAPDALRLVPEKVLMDAAYLLYGEGFEKLSEQLAAAPAVQPAAGREEIARVQGYVDQAAELGQGAIMVAASDLRAILAAISTPAQASEPIVHIQCETRSEGVIGTTNLDVVRVEQNDDGSFTVVTDHWPAQALETGGEVVDLIAAAKAVTMAAWTDRFGRLHGHETVAALERALSALSAPQAAPGEGEGES